ncbi:MAG TPA: NYN domain-containing protein, partial [archaeon]|nr:NYN domain-containing protein [archaeon]
SQFNVRLDDVERLLEKYGELKVAKVFLNQYASEKLIEAVSNIGFEPVVTTTDADVPMALAAFELIMNANIDVIALMTRDADLQHVLTKAKAHGKETILIAADEQLSASLKNTADRFILVGNAPAIQRPIPSSDIEIKD